MTGNDLIAAAMRRINALGQGQTPNASESSDAQLILNSMLDSWSTDRGNLYTVGDVNQPLVGGQQTYQVGSGAADFPNVARPVRIEAAAVVYNGLRWPLDPMGEREWNGIVQRAAVNTLPYQLFQEYGIGGTKLDGARWAAILSSSPLLVLPWKLYCDYGSPIARLNFWPVPAVNGIQMDLLVWQVLAQITDLTKDLTTFYNLPPGYVEAMRLNLALKLCEEMGSAIPPGLPGEAAQALAALRTLNEANRQLIEGAETSGAVPRSMMAPPPPPQAAPPAQQ
jgi:hypothetical protein